MFNQHYIKSTEYLVNPLNPDLNETTDLEIIKKYATYPSIVKIKNFFSDIGLFDFPEARTEDINGIIKPLNPNKAAGHDPIK